MEGVGWVGDEAGGGDGNGVDLNVVDVVGVVLSDVDCGGSGAHQGGLHHPGCCSLGFPVH